MVYTLEDYLKGLHTGQWFGFNNLNGNEENKTYANLVIFSDDVKPTEQECTDGVAALQATYDGQGYARSREAEYPTWQDQLDDIYHNGIDGWKATIKITKDKYPKG
tara:strand:- start:242 stop:559 length:318 start_codon:yes stop_codon:yes gene_type:complete